MSAINATTYPTTKSKMEKLLLAMLRFRCFMSTCENLNQDQRIVEVANQLLKTLVASVPSDWFIKNYMNRMGQLGFDGRFALLVDHNMTTVTVIRTSSLANVLQFVRGAA